jgi:hypothetical protein
MAGKKHTGNNRLYHEARREAERRRSADAIGADPIAVLQEVLDGTTADLRFAQEQVDALDLDDVFRPTAQGVVPNEWIRLRDHYREELERIANNLVRNGIAERSVNLKAAQATLIAHAIEAAALEVGLTREQVRSIGASLRRRLDEPVVVDAVEIDPPKELPR